MILLILTLLGYKKTQEISDSASLVDLLRKRANIQPDQKAFIFLEDGEIEADSLTYQELDQKSRAIAAQLQSLGATGERALLLYPPGLEFIAAFFGCLYAGVVAVPAYPPKRNQSIDRLRAIASDSGATIALTVTSTLTQVQSQFAQEPFANMRSLATDSIASDKASDWQPVQVDRDTLAFLQYTSGSTGTPKGVMVSHGNLLQNSADLDLGWEHTPNSIMVTWLPTFHDMGLIYGAIQPLYKGFPCYMMSPVSFMERPFRWLQAISHYKATHSAGPNFAYDLCVRKIPPEQRSALDLSSWRMALNGAEPVRVDVMKRFVEAFQPYGFDESAFCPGYGLAEATLKVTAVQKKSQPLFYTVNADALEMNQVVDAEEDEQGTQTLVGCGWTKIDTQIIIVNPQSLTRCSLEEVGEIWVSGSTVAQGYWRRPEQTHETFQAYLADTGVSVSVAAPEDLAGRSLGPFLRTGDLGFIKDGELFVTGRLKDVIIIRGRNHYPQDIELVVQQSHPALRPDCGAAFTVEVDKEEQLVVVQEVERTWLRKIDAEMVARAIRKAVVQQHELYVHTIALIRTGSIPKTSSGKIQRRACRAKFLEGTLDILVSGNAHLGVPNRPKVSNE